MFFMLTARHLVNAFNTPRDRNTSNVDIFVKVRCITCSVAIET
jgi:hypothetical protein